MKKTVIALLGIKGAGKDTYFNKKFNAEANEIKWAGVLKELARKIFDGIDIENRELKEKKFPIETEVLDETVRKWTLAFFDEMGYKTNNPIFTKKYGFTDSLGYQAPITWISPREFLLAFGGKKWLRYSEESADLISLFAIKKIKKSESNTVVITDTRLKTEIEFLLKHLDSNLFDLTCCLIVRYQKKDDKIKLSDALSYSSDWAEELNNHLTKVAIDVVNDEIAESELNEKNIIAVNNAIKNYLHQIGVNVSNVKFEVSFIEEGTI